MTFPFKYFTPVFNEWSLVLLMRFPALKTINPLGNIHFMSWELLCIPPLWVDGGTSSMISSVDYFYVCLHLRCICHISYVHQTSTYSILTSNVFSFLCSSVLGHDTLRYLTCYNAPVCENSQCGPTPAVQLPHTQPVFTNKS